MDFVAVAREHWARRSKMEAQDFGKLAYQNEFGPAHMAHSPDRVLSALRAECESSDGPSLPPEPIGNGLSRFHLTPTHGSLKNAPLLARLFTLTAEDRRGSGSMEGLAEKLHSLDALNIPGWADWVAEYRRQGCPLMHHSERFLNTYHPHYRLLDTSLAGFFPALRELDLLSRTGKPVVVAVDGRCGSGKTSFAAAAQRVLPCQVVHMDDFYLPQERRAADWESVPAGNMDLERLRQEVLLPAREGKLKGYRPYDCRTGQPGERVELDGCALTLVEGSYAHHPALADAYSEKIFLTCSQEEQTRRLQARDGDCFAAYQAQWVPMEERYFQTFAIEEGSGVTVDTTGLFER